jgi:hypothetical protein
MPNYCENDLYVSGPGQDIRAFMDHVKGEYGGKPLVFDFNALVPEPDVCPPLDPGGIDLGWHVTNWGTKWNALWPVLLEMDCDEGSAELHFSTAWSPPRPVILAAARRFPSLQFRLEYFETAIGFHGRYTCEAGEQVENLVGDYYGSRGG